MVSALSALSFSARRVAQTLCVVGLLVACGPPPAPTRSAADSCRCQACPLCPAEPEPEVAPAPEPEPRLVLKAAGYDALPGWQDDQQAAALGSFLRSCARLQKRKASDAIGQSEVGGTVADWLPACRAAKQVPSGDDAAARRFFEEEFQPFLAHNNDESEGGFTGYYEATLYGSRTRTGRYRYPIYKRPKDLVMVNMRNFTSLKGGPRRISGKVVGGYLQPYYTRKEIREGALKGRGLEVVWIDNPIDGFFAQIQGSGVVMLPKGKEMRIGYVGQNGHGYVAIGRELLREGHITREEMSMQAIRSWLDANPDAADEMMDRNQAYAFLDELKRTGAVGSQNVELTPERSAAIDREFIPQSAPLFIDTEVPSEDGSEMLPFRQLLIAQDSGGAIRGPVRADIFWGSGKRAAEIAGRLRSRGRYFVLLPKGLSESMSIDAAEPTTTSAPAAGD